MLHSLDFEKHGFYHNNAGDEQILYRPIKEENCGIYTFEVEYNNNKTDKSNKAIEWVFTVEDFGGRQTPLWFGNMPDQDVLDLLVKKFIYKNTNIEENGIDQED